MKNNKIVKRIVSGKYKGKVLKVPSMVTTRSSKNIVLESFFNTIQFEIIDSTFVEVFSGSGSIGLEALSRGAKEILFMERDKNALKTLKENIKNIDTQNMCEVFAGDSFLNINSVISTIKRKNVEAYFYIDPPFSIREGMEDIYEKMINLIKNLPAEHTKLIIVEHMTGLELEDTIGEFKKLKYKKFGNTSLTYFGVEE